MHLLKNFKIPHVFIFISGIILLCSILTYIIPSGSYERETKMKGSVKQTVVVPGSYKEIPKNYSVKGLFLGDKKEGFSTPVSILGVFTAIPKGLNQAASLIFFVFIIGAVVNIIKRTGTIDVFISLLLKKFKNSPILLTSLLYYVFAFASTFLGMGAEFIPLIPVLIIISKQLGYDRVFGVAVLILGMSIGWATAITNPFNVQIAQSIAELPLGSGIGLRIITFVLFTAVGLMFLLNYGKKVKANPAKSLMPNDSVEEDEETFRHDIQIMTKHIWIAVIALFLFGAILFAVQTMGWGLIEMTGGFFTVGVITILLGKMSGDESMRAFIEGLEVMIVPALIVGFARGVQVVMVEGEILDTILFQTATLLSNFHQVMAIEGIFVFQSVFNFFIPSASGQAFVTMPLIVPLSDLVDISRQTSVLAFVFGDGISNSIIPTSGVLMASIGIAKVPYEKWFRFMLPLFLILSVLGGIILAVAHFINY